jgi:hypothetical protein
MQAELEFGVSAGVSLKLLGHGLVPIHEEHEARLERGISLAAWSDMDMFEKALLIANRRIRNMISNLQAEAEIRKAKRDAKRK